MKRILWQRIDGSTMEYCTFKFHKATTISGAVVGDLGEIVGKVEYEVSCSSDGSTKSVSVQVTSLISAVSLNFTDDTVIIDMEKAYKQLFANMEVGDYTPFLRL